MNVYCQLLTMWIITALTLMHYICPDQSAVKITRENGIVNRNPYPEAVKIIREDTSRVKRSVPPPPNPPQPNPPQPNPPPPNPPPTIPDHLEDCYDDFDFWNNHNAAFNEFVVTPTSPYYTDIIMALSTVSVPAPPPQHPPIVKRQGE